VRATSISAAVGGVKIGIPYTAEVLGGLEAGGGQRALPAYELFKSLGSLSYSTVATSTFPGSLNTAPIRCLLDDVPATFGDATSSSLTGGRGWW